MRLAVMLIITLPCLASCAGPAITSLVTAGVAGGVGSATGSALAGTAVGFGVSYGVDQGVKYGERRLQGAIQAAIARSAGPLELGQSAQWETEEWLPLSGKSGTVEVARVFGTAILCKDVVFTLADEYHRVYVTTICRDDEGEWVWAEAEPSVHRWEYIQ